MRPSLGCVRTLRHLALWLGLVALTVQGLAPLHLAGLMRAPGSAASLSSIILCTARGFETVRIGADGKPVPDGPAPDQQGSTCLLCTGCHVGGAFSPPELASTLAPLSWVLASKQIVFAVPGTPLLHVSYFSN